MFHFLFLIFFVTPGLSIKIYNKGIAFRPGNKENLEREVNSILSYNIYYSYYLEIEK